MPSKPPRPCNHPGCAKLVTERFCPSHKTAEHKRVDQARRPSSLRGYDRQWRKFRAAYAAKVPAICVDCNRATTGREMHLDHIIPMHQGGAKYDEANLAWRCRRCHSTKTAREDGGYGRKPQGGGVSKSLEGLDR